MIDPVASTARNGTTRVPPNAEARRLLAGWQRGTEPLLEVLQGHKGVGWAEARAIYTETLAELFPDPEGVSISGVDMGGVPGTMVTPERVHGDRILFYIHGGGYVGGSPTAYRRIADYYALSLGARVYMPDYRLAPEHPYPTPIEDTFRAYRSLLDEGHDPQSIVFSGDSAGGAMVITVMVKARNAGLPLPAAGVAISPWANLEHTAASMDSRDGLDPLVSRESLTLMARTFLAGALPGDPDASPVFADVRGLPPTLVQIGENEVMLSDAVRLAGHLGENRVRASLEIWPGMFHVWHLFSGVIPQADQALGSAAAFLEQQLAVTA